MRHAKRMTRYSGEDIYRIAAHMLTALASAPADDRGEAISEWAGRLDGDQQAHVVAAALQLSLTAIDHLAVTPLLQQAIDQALTAGREYVGPLPTSFTPPGL